jgi:glycosyltransferase involved in cell wall biosynthesis
MRILMVVHQFFPEFAGGTERVTLNLARMAQRAGHHVRILACTVEPEKFAGMPGLVEVSGMLETVYQGVPVSLLKRSDLPAAADISLLSEPGVTRNLVEWIGQQRFDVAHIMHSMRMGSAIMALQNCLVPYVVHLTDFYLPCARINLIDLENQLCPGPDEGRRCALQCAVPPWTTEAYAERYVQSKSVLDAAGARIAPSEYVADCYRRAYPGMNIQVIPHGIDLLAMSAALDPGAGPTDGPLRLIYVGSLVPQKGIDVLLRALALMPGTNLELKIVGGFYGNTVYQQEIRQLAANDPRIEFCGVLDAADVFRRLGKSDVLCLPSKVPESFSLVLHESAAAAVPMFVSNLGAPAQQVSSSGCGLVLPSGDVKAWADAVRSVVDDRSLLAAWKKNLFLPLRIEEEAFFINSLYLRVHKAQA